jgi:hypothetical protein
MKKSKEIKDVAKSLIAASEKKDVPMLPLMAAIIGLLALVAYAMHLLASR